VKNKNIPAINRIVIGDVGSGKTIVAFIIASLFLHGSDDSSQVAMLAPTEILAFQHYHKLLEFCNDTLPDKNSFDTIFLTSKNIFVNGNRVTKTQLDNLFKEGCEAFDVEKKRIKLNTKKIFWIGTHALLHSKSLSAGLVMVDEQHRFGVGQRQKLSGSKSGSAHFISFTATPIPRTLALTMYRNLKPQFLKTLPGRNVIKTNIELFEKFESNVIRLISDELNKGRKVYIVCAKIDEDEVDDEDKEGLWSIQKVKKIMDNYFAGQVISTYGKMSDKSKILQQFKESDDKNILIATTVIEVGVDVPMASMVVVCNAERFGLAALHQIRGRVGRNSFDDNYCIFVTHKRYSFSKRLKYLTQYSDGFTLAQKDLELRGAGDMLGKVQSGLGDEIDGVISLGSDIYNSVQDAVDSVDIELLPRLAKYLDTKLKKVWEE